MVCVAANAQDSLKSVPTWANEIRQACPMAPIVLIMTKIDLLEYCDEPVDLEQAKQKSKEQAF